MRLLLAVPLVAVAAVIAGGCQCSGSGSASTVTLRFKNTGNAPLYLDDTSGQLGMQVQQSVSGSFTTVAEQVSCSCQTCDNACSTTSCSCSAPTPSIVRVDPGQTLERTWQGSYQQQVASTCGGLIPTGGTCLREQSAGASDTFNLHACYSPSSKGSDVTDGGVVDGGVPFSGTVPDDGVDCVDKTFAIKDKTVEVSPTAGKSCAQTTECNTDGGELCFASTCTKSCPDNQFPKLGNNWELLIPEQDDSYFTRTITGNRVTYTGTGIVGSVSYSNGTMSLSIHTMDGSGTATIYATIPGGFAVPFSKDEVVSVLMVDTQDDTNHINLATVIRDSVGNLLLAADMAEQGFLLTPTDTAPFTVTTAGKTVGCDFTDACGKVSYDQTVFTGGSPTASVDPGQTEVVTSDTATFTVLNVSNSNSLAPVGCNVAHPKPYAILNQRKTP